MTIDERLEKLAQTLDLLARMHVDNQMRLRENDERFQKLLRENETRLRENEARLQENEEHFQKLFQENETRFQQVTRNFEIVLDSIKRLENIAASYEQRIDDLEDR